MERFGFDAQIAKMAEKDLLVPRHQTVRSNRPFTQAVDNVQMGSSLRNSSEIGAEQSNEEA